MSGIVDPSTPEREAREGAEKYLLTLDYTGREHKRKVLDAYAAAVRARALADVAGWVEGMMVKERTDHRIGNGPCAACSDNESARGWNAPLDAILAKLREAK